MQGVSNIALRADDGVDFPGAAQAGHWDWSALLSSGTDRSVIVHS